MWRRCRPDGLTFGVLVALSVAFFASARFPPDWSPAREADAASIRDAASDDLQVQDFAYVLNYARRAAARPGRSPYSLDEHRGFLRAWLGPRVGSALCFAYGPTAVLLLGPLFALPTAWAWLVWNVVSAWLAAWALRSLAGADRRLLNVGRLALLGASAFHCLALGQTALFTTGVLAGAVIDEDRGRWNEAAAACVLMLTMKPPLALVAAAALVAAGRWRPVLVALAGTLVVLAGAVAWWGGAVIGDYVSLVAHYNLVQADPIFRAGFVPELMPNLRNVVLWTGWLDDAQASAVSSLLFAASLVVPVLLAAMRSRPLALDLAVGLTVTGYALFSPHLSPTEDLALVVPMLMLGRRPAGSAPSRRVVAGLSLVPQWLGGSTASIARAVGAGAMRVLPAAAFAAKLALGGVLATVIAAEYRAAGRS